MFVALVPAAGQSKRFGGNKLAQVIGSRSVLEHVITALRLGGAELTLVILSRENNPLVAQVQAAGAIPFLLEHPTSDMRETLEVGLAWLTRQGKVPQAWLVCPADYPAIRASTVRRLLLAFRCGPRDAVYVPTYCGQRGHPVLLGWEHAQGLARFQRPAGLNSYVRQQTVVEVPVNWPGILYDLDTPEDLARIRALLETPSSELV